MDMLYLVLNIIIKKEFKKSIENRNCKRFTILSNIYRCL